MLNQLKYSVALETIENALSQLPSDEFRYTINQPVDNFFYGNWVLKPEFIGTPWEILYNSLELPKGEARIIKLNPSESYISHADIDDRYHLNLFSKRSYLIDLDNNVMHPLTTDGYWYEMDAGRRHTASNFGNRTRYQLVVRKPLNKGKFDIKTNVTIIPKNGVDLEDARFIFDDVLSPWLNKLNKEYSMNNFNYQNGIVTFEMDQRLVKELKSMLPTEFELKDL